MAGRGGAALPGRKELGRSALEGCPPRAGCGKERAVTGDDTRSTKASGAALTLYGPTRRGRGGAGVGGASHPVGPASRPDNLPGRVLSRRRASLVGPLGTPRPPPG